MSDQVQLPDANQLAAMSDEQLAKLRAQLKPSIRQAQSLLAHLEREIKHRRRRRKCH